MKKTILATLGLLAALLVPATCRAYSNLADAQFAQAAQISLAAYVQAPASGVTPLQITSSTGSPAMVLTYSGPAADAEITVTQGALTTGIPGTSGCIAFYAPAGTLDTSIGLGTCGNASGTFDLGVSSGGQTMGQLCDQINGIAPFALNANANGGAPTGGNWHCTLVGAIRSDFSGQILPAVTAAAKINSASAVGGYAVPFASNTVISLGIIPTAGHHIILNGCYGQGAGNAAAPPSLYVYGVPLKFSGLKDFFGNSLTDSYQNLVFPMTSATSTYFPSSYQYQTNAPLLEFGPVGGNQPAGSNAAHTVQYSSPGTTVYNGHVVVRLGAFASGNGTQVGPTDFLNCSWTEK